jgi:hypothetical protein
MHSGRSTIIRKSKYLNVPILETAGTPTSHHKQHLLMVQGRNFIPRTDYLKCMELCSDFVVKE